MIAIYWGVGSWLILEVGGTFLVYTRKKQLDRCTSREVSAVGAGKT